MLRNFRSASKRVERDFPRRCTRQGCENCRSVDLPYSFKRLTVECVAQLRTVRPGVESILQGYSKMASSIIFGLQKTTGRRDWDIKLLIICTTYNTQVAYLCLIILRNPTKKFKIDSLVLENTSVPSTVALVWHKEVTAADSADSFRNNLDML